MGNITVFIIVIGILVVKSIVGSKSAQKETKKGTYNAPTAEPIQSVETAKPKPKKNNIFLNEEEKIGRRTSNIGTDTKIESDIRTEEQHQEYNLQDAEEMKRAIIYSEILNRKY